MQDYITIIYSENPRLEDNPLCVHPVISALAWEYKLAFDEDWEPQYDQITYASIKKCIEATEKSQPLWPMILKSTSLATKAEKDPKLTWWLQPNPKYLEEEEKEKEEEIVEVVSGEWNDEGEDDGDDGCTYLFLFCSPRFNYLQVVCWRSSQTMKGWAPAPPDFDVMDKHIGQSRKQVNNNNKDNNDGNYDDGDDGNDDGVVNINSNEIMDNPTPWKSEGKGKMPAMFHVVVDSPPQPPPKQCLQMNEAGDSINVSDLGQGEGQDWVTTGKVCEHWCYFCMLIVYNLSSVKMQGLQGKGQAHVCSPVGQKEDCHHMCWMCKAEEGLHHKSGMEGEDEGTIPSHQICWCIYLQHLTLLILPVLRCRRCISSQSIFWQCISRGWSITMWVLLSYAHALPFDIVASFSSTHCSCWSFHCCSLQLWMRYKGLPRCMRYISFLCTFSDWPSFHM